ncbi:IS1380 family transposase, partial [Actinomadura sp. LD22]|nr:IS1380 family transposase [Actinomadura physcomitrii]
QTFADLTDGPVAHLPSGHFAANAAWLTCAAITHNLLRAAGCLASAFHARARGATLRRHLVQVPARLARHGRSHLTLHLPEHWPWAPAWLSAFQAVHPPPAAAA